MGILATFPYLSRICREILADRREAQPVYWIAMASGTPQVQTVWFLLTQSGRFPATLFKPHTFRKQAKEKFNL
jgi:sigma54-dependent transcription regulator